MVVVVSSFVDSTIREGQSDTDFVLFHTLDELAQYIEQTPIRATELFFTKETIPYANTALNYLSTMLDNPFFKVDRVIYITEYESKEIASVKYIIDEKKFDNWEIVEGFLTREYVNGIIKGTLRKDVLGAKRKAVYRIPRASYVQDRLKNKESLDEHYVDDEEYLKGIEPVTLIEETISDIDNVCKIISLVGLDCDERTAFSLLLSQYLAFSGKTLLIEKDVEYHRLTEFITKSDLDCYRMEIADLIADVFTAVDLLKRVPLNLVCVTSVDRINYSYNFIANLLYDNLADNYSYFVNEEDFNEVSVTENCIVVVPTTTLGVLKTCEKLDCTYIDKYKFVGVDLQSLKETRINNSVSLKTLMSDILEVEIPDFPIVRISSLKLGGSEYDLRRVVGVS
jgi:hypothetical protein